MEKDLYREVKAQLKEVLIEGIKLAFKNSNLAEKLNSSFNVETPDDPTLGDLSTNAAFIGAKILKKSPLEVAEQILEFVNLEGTYFKKCEFKKPGFINFFFKDEWFNEVIRLILVEKENYGRVKNENKGDVVVEFVSANPTGPMHIGNARGGAMGDCLATILSFAGFNVVREFYVNDYGNQIEKFKKSLSIRYLQLFNVGGAVLTEECYKGEDVLKLAEEFAKIHGDCYVNKSEKERSEALINYALPKNIKQLESDLLKYGIKYDVWFKESLLHENGFVTDVINKLKEKNATYEKDGALWFKFTEFGGEKDEVLIRENKLPTYFAADIAYHYNKLVTRNFNLAINLWGADHHGHVSRLKGALEALGVNSNRLEIVLMQMVRLVRGNETVKLSKRSGKAISLVTLLQEIPIDAARFFFNLRETNTHLDLDLDLAVEQTSKNPVYYVQYAYARNCQVLKKLAELGFKPNLSANFKLLQKVEETNLIKGLAKFPGVIEKAARERSSAEITRYAILIATLFHKFYDECRIKGEDEPILIARLGLSEVTGIVLKEVLGILKVRALEEI